MEGIYLKKRLGEDFYLILALAMLVVGILIFMTYLYFNQPLRPDYKNMQPLTLSIAESPYITPLMASNIARKAIGGKTKSVIFYIDEYQVNIKKGLQDWKVHVSSYTGEIKDIKYISSYDVEIGFSKAANLGGYENLNEKQAVRIAQKNIVGNLVDVKYEQLGNINSYNVLLDDGYAKRMVYVDALTGEITDVKRLDPNRDFRRETRGPDSEQD